MHRVIGERKNFQRYQCAVKRNSPLKLQIVQIFTANFNDYLKFTGIIRDVSERWSSGIRRCWHSGVDRFEPVYGSFFFARNPLIAVKKMSPLKTANLTNRPLFLRIQSYKMRALCGEKNFFHSYSPLTLHYFLSKLRPGKLDLGSLVKNYIIFCPNFDPGSLIWVPW